MPAQPSTPQPLQGITPHQVPALQGGIFQHTPSTTKLDSQIHTCYMDELFHSPHATADDMAVLHRFNNIPLYAIGQGNTHLSTMNLDNPYPGSIGQVNQSTMDLSYSPLGLRTTPHNSPTSLPSTSSHDPMPQKGCYKYMGLQNATYSLKNVSSMGQPTPSMAYSQQLAQARQQMLIDPWYGYESYGVYNI